VPDSREKSEEPEVLEVDNLVRSFGALRAVDGVSLRVERGSITGLIGPNGAGKTTLFNLVAGALAPDAGRIVLDGRRIDALRADRVFHAGLARTFQIPRPFPDLSVLDNLLLAPAGQSGERFWNAWLARSRIAAEEARARERALEWLDFVGLAPLQHRPARELSGGQHKLLELARALMNDPAIVLLDEPAAGVAPALVETIAGRIAALNARGLTFMLIEHNLDVVMQLCHTVVVMAQGRVVMQGVPDAVRSDPRVIDAYLGDVV
jgi:branched-chain amino acid transport system ATP-binding protein